MRYLVRSALVALVVLGLAGSAHAGTIFNFTSMADGAYGEGAWSSLVLNYTGGTVTITGHATDDTPSTDLTQYAYLDSGNAGLGVCKDVAGATALNSMSAGRTTNNCNPSSDDNITTNEYLKFVFSSNVTINNFWFNNNHDGGFGAGDMVDINGSLRAVSTGVVGGVNGIGSFNVAANTAFKVKFSNEQFYISGMEVTKNVPDQATTLGLLSLGILSLFAIKLRVG